MPLVAVSTTTTAPPVTTTCDIVTVADYRRVTGDTLGTSTVVQEAVDEAVQIVEGRLGRRLCRDTYTEPLRPDSSGRVWPTATPLVSVSVPAGAVIRGNAILVGGGWWGRDYTIVGWPGSPPTEVEVTYVGGFTRELFPAKLRRAVCLLAWLWLHPITDEATSSSTVVSNLLANASSIRVGDVAVTSSSSSGGDSSSNTSSGSLSSGSLTSQISAYLAPFRRRHLVP